MRNYRKIYKFYASILFDNEVEAPRSLCIVRKITSINLGSFHLSIKSNDRKNANLRFVKLAEKNLRCKQYQLSRKIKGCANCMKA